MTEDIALKTPPAIDLPARGGICELSIIDTTCNITAPAVTLVEPVIPGHEFMNFPTVSFLIQNQHSGKQVLFDLGCRKDFWNSPPHIAKTIEAHVPGIKVDRDLTEILAAGGVQISDLQAAIISHHHYDHIGNPALLPKDVHLVVGPGFIKNFLPGYPTSQTSPLHVDALENRVIDEIHFSDELTIGGFQAHDYFRDGSLYILNVPGHAIGHISALVRTTNTTFALLAGDACHFGGSFRPTEYVPMPSELPGYLKLDSSYPTPCPCSRFKACHPNPDKSRTTPFYEPCSASNSWYVDPPLARESIHRLKAFDALEDVLVLIAHDPSIMDILPFFPNETLNGWKTAGWKELVRWGFLDELPIKGRPRPYLVDGTYIEGRKVGALNK